MIDDMYFRVLCYSCISWLLDFIGWKKQLRIWSNEGTLSKHEFDKNENVEIDAWHIWENRVKP